MHLETNSLPPTTAGQHDLDKAEGLSHGWWLLPSAVLGLAGWVGIFYGLGLL
jgi:hypothetical protein